MTRIGSGKAAIIPPSPRRSGSMQSLLAWKPWVFLWGIAEDYRKVKNYVYKSYSGIRSLERMILVYDILTDMRHSGLREDLGICRDCYSD